MGTLKKSILGILQIAERKFGPHSASNLQGDCRKMVYRIGLAFDSYSRRGNRRLGDYVTVGATQKTDEKTSKITSAQRLVE